MPSFHWSNMHAGHAYKGFAKYCAYKLRKDGAKSRLRAVSFLLENLWAIAIYMWVLIYRTRSQIFKQMRDCSKSNSKLNPAWGWCHKRISWGKISVRFPHSPMHLLCISLYVWTLKECMRLLHACKINVWGKLKFYPLYRQSGAPSSIT